MALSDSSNMTQAENLVKRIFKDDKIENELNISEIFYPSTHGLPNFFQFGALNLTLSASETCLLYKYIALKYCFLFGMHNKLYCSHLPVLKSIRGQGVIFSFCDISN